MIREVFKDQLLFDITGLNKEMKKGQLANFKNIFTKTTGRKIEMPGSWIDAFFELEIWLDTKMTKKKKVIFFDEFPWLAARKSGFLPAFENFWNAYVSKRKDLVVVVCGSAASFMIQNIIKNKGGLLNRVTRKMRLLPFSLGETEQFLRQKNIKWGRYDIAQIYMALGGVPHYLDQLSKGESIHKALDRLIFNEQGLLAGEFNELFDSLFENKYLHRM